MSSSIKLVYKCLLVCIVLTFSKTLSGQYLVKGEVENFERNIAYDAYLSIIRNWNDFQNINSFDIINKSELDSSGTFTFTGSELPDEQAFYRVHFAPSSNPTLILGYPKNYFSFLLSNKDSIELTIKSQVLATVLQVKSTLEENDMFVPLSIVLDYLKTQIFELSDLNTDDDNEKITKDQQSSGESYQTNQIQLLEGKRRTYLLNVIQQSDLALIQIYCAYYAKLNYKNDPLIFDRLAKGLKDKNYLESYSTSLSNYILSNSYETILVKFRRWKMISIVLIVIVSMLIIYTVWSIQKRSQAKSKPSSNEQLTSKEIQVYNLISEHKTNKEIADQLFISASTVKTHVNNIYRKLGIKSRQELIQSDKVENQPGSKP